MGRRPKRPPPTVQIEKIPDEKWRSVEGYGAKYQVSNMGRLMGFHYRSGRPRLLKGYKNSFGYIMYMLKGKDGKMVGASGHRLVLKAFSKRSDISRKICAMHLNNDPSDNRLENLKWGTLSDNNLHMKNCDRHAKGSRSAGALLTEIDVERIKALHATDVPLNILAIIFGVKKHTLHAIFLGRNWKHV